MPNKKEREILRRKVDELGEPVPKGDRRKVKSDSDMGAAFDSRVARAFILGSLATFIVLAAINGIADWFGNNPVFSSAVVYPIISVIGGIIIAIIRSTSND